MTAPWPGFAWLSADTGRTEEELTRAFAGWGKETFELRGAPVLGILRKGTEVHCVLAPAWRGSMLPRRTLREWVEALLRATGGMLTTRVLLTSHAPNRFVERVGFVRTWADDAFNYYALTSAPFGRKTP